MSGFPPKFSRPTKLSAQEGFSLIELLVSLVLFALLSYAVFTLILKSTNNSEISASLVKENAELQNSLNDIQGDLSQAQVLLCVGSIVDAAANSSCTQEMASSSVVAPVEGDEVMFGRTATGPGGVQDFLGELIKYNPPGSTVNPNTITLQVYNNSSCPIPNWISPPWLSGSGAVNAGDGTQSNSNNTDTVPTQCQTSNTGAPEYDLTNFEAKVANSPEKILLNQAVVPTQNTPVFAWYQDPNTPASYQVNSACQSQQTISGCWWAPVSLVIVNLRTNGDLVASTGQPPQNDTTTYPNATLSTSIYLDLYSSGAPSNDCASTTAKPTAVLSITPPGLSYKVNQNLNFNGSNSTDSSGVAITNYDFNPGNGSADLETTASTTTYNYSTTGTFTPGLTVTDANGNTSTQVQETITVTN